MRSTIYRCAHMFGQFSFATVMFESIISTLTLHLLSSLRLPSLRPPFQPPLWLFSNLFLHVYFCKYTITFRVSIPIRTREFNSRQHVFLPGVNEIFGILWMNYKYFGLCMVMCLSCGQNNYRHKTCFITSGKCHLCKAKWTKLWAINWTSFQWFVP